MESVSTSLCPVEITVSMISNKWRVLIIRDLLKGTHRFGELQRSISQKVLTQNLREMEAAGLITRHVYPVVPPRVEYSLTDRGRSLEPVIDAMRIWGTHYTQNDA